MSGAREGCSPPPGDRLAARSLEGIDAGMAQQIMLPLQQNQREEEASAAKEESGLLLGFSEDHTDVETIELVERYRKTKGVANESKRKVLDSARGNICSKQDAR